METTLISRDNRQEIADKIQKGALVALPTDTVYGLAGVSNIEASYNKLLIAKGRPENKPFPLMVSSKQQIEDLVELDERARFLIEMFMPGPVTFVFKMKPTTFPFLKKVRTLGIRMADDEWICSIIEKVGSPIWLPSANLSGHETALNYQMVMDQLSGRIEYVVEGKSKARRSSSVFDISGKEIQMLRQGVLSLEDLNKEVNLWRKQ